MLKSLIFNHINILTVVFVSLIYVYNFYLEHKNSAKTNYVQFLYLVISISSAFAHYYSNPTFYIFDGDISKTENILFSLILGLVFFSQSLIKNYKKNKYNKEDFSQYIKNYTEENISNINFRPNHDTEYVNSAENISKHTAQERHFQNEINQMDKNFRNTLETIQSEIKKFETLTQKNEADLQELTLNLTQFLKIINKKVNKIVDDINEKTKQ